MGITAGGKTAALVSSPSKFMFADRFEGPHLRGSISRTSPRSVSNPCSVKAQAFVLFILFSPEGAVSWRPPLAKLNPLSKESFRKLAEALGKESLNTLPLERLVLLEFLFLLDGATAFCIKPMKVTILSIPCLKTLQT